MKWAIYSRAYLAKK